MLNREEDRCQVSTEITQKFHGSQKVKSEAYIQHMATIIKLGGKSAEQAMLN